MGRGLDVACCRGHRLGIHAYVNGYLLKVGVAFSLLVCIRGYLLEHLRSKSPLSASRSRYDTKDISRHSSGTFGLKLQDCMGLEFQGLDRQGPHKHRSVSNL